MFFPVDMPDMTYTQDQVVIAQAQQKQIDKGIDLHIGVCALVGYPPYPGSGGVIVPGFDVHLYYEHVEGLINDRYPGNETVTLLKEPQHGILESIADGHGRAYKYFPDPDYFSNLPPLYSDPNNFFKVDQASFLVSYEGKNIQVDTRIAIANSALDFNEDNPRDMALYKKLCPSGNYWKINGSVNQNGSSSINIDIDIDSLEQISVKTEEASTSDNKVSKPGADHNFL